MSIELRLECFVVFESHAGSQPRPASLADRQALSLLVVLRLQAVFGIAQKTVTYDLARQMEGATELKCSEFGAAIIEKL